ncbi:hypothetical protein GOBAR_AA05614 [Gossypium barbadense]|uniref:Uncharacterized protein n=1 Tax=Gossypium barbadense TaxID=3634 RepID=A0A2P5YHA6_GOSBA|nr:hypothetical protein GOBAR_AA05614 [Gossypium barbadense]
MSTFGDVEEIDRECDVEWVETDGEGVQTTKEGVFERVEVTREGVEATREGDVEGVETAREGDVEKVKVDREGVTTARFEADEYGSEESGGHMSLRSTVGEDNDSGFGSSVGYGEEESEIVLDGNETKEEHNCLVSFKNKMVVVAMIAQHFEATIKDHPKMKLKEIQRRYASEMPVNDYAQELRSRMSGSTIKVGLKIAISDMLPRMEYRNCAWHMFANWSGRKIGNFFEFNFWKIMKSTIEKEWGELCAALEKKDKDAYDNLMRKSPNM